MHITSKDANMKRLHTIGCACYMKLWKMQSYGKSKRVQWMPEVTGPERNRQSTEDFKGSKLLCIIL